MACLRETVCMPGRGHMCTVVSPQVVGDQDNRMDVLWAN